ncbi:MAG: SEL1-like repeat protein [Pseudomonadota bacterium]
MADEMKVVAGDARFLQQQLMMAMSGDAEALYELGVAYSVGRAGVDVDLIAAHKWFNLAALKGDERAKEDRSEISAEMSPAEIAEAQRDARAFLKLAA